MLHQIVEIQQENRYLCLERGFLKIRENETDVAKVPLDDIAVLLLSAQGCSLSKNILVALAERGAVTIICGKNYTPIAVVAPTTGQFQQAGILKHQINASLPLKKNLWKKIVEQKLLHQSLVLKAYDCDKANYVEALSHRVKSGDSDNRESVGAKIYWTSLFGENFKRDKDGGDGINAMLNYGYAVIRASMCRAIFASGLQPALGIHHDNALNPFCLADDLFEIYRPLVDMAVYEIADKTEDGECELSPSVKQKIIQCLWIKLKTTEGDSPAFQSMQYLASSFVKALKNKTPELHVPIWEGSCEKFSCAE